MPSAATLGFKQSQRMTDNADGGGRMGATKIVSGVRNSIYDDVTDVDRAAGDLSVRKAYAADESEDASKYLDAGVAIFRAPADPAVSVLAFSTGDFYDERAAIVARLESSISRGSRYNGWLSGQHIAGQRAVLIWTRPEVALPKVGERLNLVAHAGGVQQYDEVLWITDLSVELRAIRDSLGEYQVQIITCEIAYQLENDYVGLEPQRYDPSTTALTALIYETRYNADIVPLFGIKPLIASAGIDDFTVRVDSLYQQIIPTGLQETALADATPGGSSAALIAGSASGSAGFTTTLNLVKPDGTLYLGGPVQPGTLVIVVSGATLTDSNGSIKLGATEVGRLECTSGIARFTSACPNYGTALKTIAYRPAARDLRVAETASIAVTVGNRGYVYVITLSPIPAPLSLQVSYQVNGVWYTLYDQGNGLLSGADSSYGAGTLNLATVTITTGELPDVDSLILLAWTTPVNYKLLGGTTPTPVKIRGTVAHTGLVPGEFSISWGGVSVAEPVTPDGTLTGTGGTGTVDHATGDWTLIPTVIPAVGTEFTLAYDYTASTSVKTESFDSPPRELDDSIILTLSQTDLEPRSVRVRYPVGVASASAIGWGAVTQPALASFNVTVKDDGAGALTDDAGTVDLVNGVITLTPDREINYPVPHYTQVTVGTAINNLGVTVPLTRLIATAWDPLTVEATFPADGVITVEYRLDGDTPSTTEIYTLDQVELDLTVGYAETVVPGSVLVTLGDSRYVNTAGQIYRDPSPDTGAGTLAGSLDPTTGIVRLSNWIAQPNIPVIKSLVTVIGGQPIDTCIFRTALADIRPGSLQVRATTTTGTVISKTIPQSGLLEDNDLTAWAKYLDGVISLRFGVMKTVVSLTSEELLEPWYSPDLIQVIGGISKIWKPTQVLADSIVYNAVAQTVLPPDKAMLGLDVARLPPDGKALIFQRGRLALIHHTDTLAASSLTATQVIDCGRERLYRAVIEDSAGLALSPVNYALNRELGTITLSPTLDLTGLTAPFTVRHTVADLVRVTAVDISGKLTLNKPVSHVFPSDESFVSGVLYIGTMQARVENLFAQLAWTNEWSDTRIGDEPLAQYNDVQYPIIVTNLGAYPDRILIKFTSTTAFQVIGENLGLIGTGTTSADCSPLNTMTGIPYLTIDYRGWGSGWPNGACLRFNIVGACYPVDLIRAIQPSNPSGLDVDSVELLLLGNVDA
jgi:hypothetical protein